MWKDGLPETRDRNVFLNVIMRNILYGYKKYLFIRMQKFMKIRMYSLEICPAAGLMWQNL